MTEIVRGPQKSTIFALWPFKENVCRPCSWQPSASAELPLPPFHHTCTRLLQSPCYAPAQPDSLTYNFSLAPGWTPDPENVWQEKRARSQGKDNILETSKERLKGTVREIGGKLRERVFSRSENRTFQEISGGHVLWCS